MMAHQKLRAYIKKRLTFTDAELHTILKCFKPLELAKKEYLLKEGDIPKYEAYVINGLLRQYILNDDGKEHTLYFAAEDWWVSDIYAFLHQKPANINIQALEDSEVLVISKADKMMLFDAIPKTERLYRIMSQNALGALQLRITDNLMKTADQRYLDYIEKYPDIALRVTNVQMASYLGISPEFLSRIKTRLKSS